MCFANTELWNYSRSIEDACYKRFGKVRWHECASGVKRASRCHFNSLSFKIRMIYGWIAIASPAAHKLTPKLNKINFTEELQSRYVNHCLKSPTSTHYFSQLVSIRVCSLPPAETRDCLLRPDTGCGVNRQAGLFLKLPNSLGFFFDIYSARERCLSMCRLYGSNSLFHPVCKILTTATEAHTRF